ncbi:MAG TPA: hypothetical protein VFL60_06690 [Gaiellaceae bacterium]|nr:hypothetical protein [Gaiellaceae bacterium]
MKVVRVLFVLCAAALLGAGAARADVSSDFAGHHRQVFRVVVVPGLTLGDLPQLATEGAVGLLVPNAGPRTSQGDAFAGMVRGILYNTRLPRPKDSVLIHVQKSTEIPSAGPVIVVGLPQGGRTANDRRFPIAVIGHGYHGLLVSSLTRLPGLVSMADVARTALQTPHALEWRRDGGAVASSYRLESQIEVARTTTMPTSVLVLSLLVFVALLLPAGAPAAVGAALLANLALGWHPTGDTMSRVALVGACTVAGALVGPRRRTPLGLALVGVLVAYAVTMIVQPWSLALAPIGPELTSRFFGISNLLETLLLVPALVGARLLTERFGWTAFAAIGALSLAVIAENRLGSDGGGAIVVGVAFALLGVRMAGARPRYAVSALGGAALVVLGLANLDAASSTPDHLRGALQGGVQGLMHVAANRVPLAYDRMLEQWWLLVPLFFVLAVGALAGRFAPTRAQRAAVLALLGGLLASLLVNDSPGPVMIGGLTALFAVEAGVLHRMLAVPVLRRLVPAKPALEP